MFETIHVHKDQAHGLVGERAVRHHRLGQLRKPRQLNYAGHGVTHGDVERSSLAARAPAQVQAQQLARSVQLLAPARALMVQAARNLVDAALRIGEVVLRAALQHDEAKVLVW